MAWTSPRTWTTGEILTASLLNTHLRDDLIYLKGTTGLTIIEGTLCAENSTAAFKHLLNRQGGSSSDWQSPGTSNQVETGAFMQAGVIRLAFAGDINKTTTVTLPITVNSTNTAIAFASVQPSHGLGGGIFNAEAYLSAPTTLTVWGYYIPGSATTGNVDVNWLVICK